MAYKIAVAVHLSTSAQPSIVEGEATVVKALDQMRRATTAFVASEPAEREI